MVARLRRARLVRGAARARLPGHLGPAGELDLQHRRREQPDPAARLRLPQPARHRVRARDRASSISSRAGGPGGPSTAGRSPTPGFSGRIPGRRTSRSRSGSSCSPSPSGGCCRSRSRLPRSSSASASSRRSRTSARRRATRRRARRTSASKGQQNPGVSDDPLSAGDASTSSHLRNLRDGIRTVIHHPLGFGLGNAGVSASRTGVELKAGESTYTEIGVEIGRRRPRRLPRLDGRRPARVLAPLGLAERRVGGDAGDRRADRRDRRPLDRVRALRARGRGGRRRPPATTATRESSRHESPRRPHRPLPRRRAPDRVRARASRSSGCSCSPATRPRRSPARSARSLFLAAGGGRLHDCPPFRTAPIPATMP